MSLRLITAPVNLTVSLETARSFLRVDGTAEDALITSYLKAASEQGETWSRRAFITQTLEQTIDAWPDDSIVTLWRPPLQSVTSLKVIDADGAESTWTDYIVDAKSQPGRILLRSKPNLTLQDTGAIVVRYVAGYGNSEAAIPERIKLAVLNLVAHWYENRGVGDVPAGIRSAFMRERVVWF